MIGRAGLDQRQLMELLYHQSKSVAFSREREWHRAVGGSSLIADLENGDDDSLSSDSDSDDNSDQTDDETAADNPDASKDHDSDLIAELGYAGSNFVVSHSRLSTSARKRKMEASHVRSRTHTTTVAIGRQPPNSLAQIEKSNYARVAKIHQLLEDGADEAGIDKETPKPKTAASATLETNDSTLNRHGRPRVVVIEDDDETSESVDDEEAEFCALIPSAMTDGGSAESTTLLLLFSLF